MNAGEILAAFPRYSALVVGDICLDRWCTYSPAAAEPSRETGIARIAVTATEVTPGAGGTVANNLAALGVGRVTVLGVCGDDGFGFELRGALEARNISHELLIAHPGIATFTYTKLLNGDTGEEDQPRVDFIRTEPLPAPLEAEVIERLRASAPEYDIIFVSDQAETGTSGVVTARVREALRDLARSQAGKIVWVDSRLRSHLFRNVILKPNEAEAAAASAAALGRTDYAALRRSLDSPLLFITQGPGGVLVVDNGGECLVPAVAVSKPVDICGAGDSFSAGAAVAFAVTGSAMEAARFGNLVASITIMKKGTGTASPREVRAAAGVPV